METAPFEDLEVDFTEISPTKGSKYLLVMVCTYSRWINAFPSQTEWSQEAAKALLREVVPSLGFP
jgi:hypothetical protein